jgi:UDP-2,3-diacylglucosamine pyrophosphatase LpxH
MDIIAKHKFLPIFVIGDVHGNFDNLKYKIKYYDLNNIILFQAGDFGVGFNYNDERNIKKEHRTLLDINGFLKRRNIFLYVIRGNHDNPIFFKGEKKYTNIIFMKDYDVVEIGKYKILGIGGATSVDRKPNPNFTEFSGKPYKGRRENVDWWEDEKVVYNEDKLNKMIGIDIVIAHTVPNFVYLPMNEIQKWIEHDDTLLEQLKQEKEIVTKIFNKLDELNFIKFWFCGHYHRTKTELHGITRFCILDICELREIILDN